MTDGQEAQWLVEEIRALANEGHARADMAVLYRSNAQSRVIEHALFSAGLPYRVYGGLRFFERAEVKHALAYLRLMENPNDDGALLRVVNFPTRGIGARSLEALQDAAKAANLSLFAAIHTLTGGAAAKLGAFARLIETLRAETRTMPLPELVEHVVTRSGLLAHYQGEKEGQDRIENLRELVNAAVAFLSDEGIGQDVPADLGVANVAAPAAGPRFRSGADFDGGAVPVAEVAADDASQLATDATPALSPLAAFLSHASLEAGENQAGEGDDAVQLMTTHSAKGLEFDAVFVTGLEEGLFPHENALTQSARFGEAASAGGAGRGQATPVEQGLEEERRLMYVAITRARQRLYLSFSQTRMLHGQTRYSLKSRFIDELPDAALKWLTPARAEPRCGLARRLGRGLLGEPGPGARPRPRRRLRHRWRADGRHTTAGASARTTSVPPSISIAASPTALARASRTRASAKA